MIDERRSELSSLEDLIEHGSEKVLIDARRINGRTQELLDEAGEEAVKLAEIERKLDEMNS